eukprot:TRINITY_DN6157_c0_g1_i1.p2 TRINITY_DN6157_c0_g1~~TRINITY_DN6157_c0_g1_i1.p2  ORF type:complete len:384 (+),score=119.11 TRINITY_DN6157_c0_g1_i1:196-1347(+)
MGKPGHDVEQSEEQTDRLRSRTPTDAKIGSESLCKVPSMTVDRPMIWGIEVKWFVLPLLVVQNASAVLMMRAVRSLPGETGFNTQSAVVMQEVFKCLACIVLMLRQDGSIAGAWEKPVEALKTAVPALLYLCQNNLQYIAAETLDAATYTVSYQSKIIWTGILTVWLLKRHLSCNKWLALILMSVGLALVNLGGGNRTEKKARADVSAAERLGGLITILVAACCSSLAGVYFEKILKGVKVSLWTRNLQLAAYSIITGGIAILASAESRQKIDEQGFFHGFTWMTWLCVAMNAFGGLLVGTVIKYADAVMKDVSLGASIVLSTLGSIAFLHYEIHWLVALGMALVIYSVFLYGGRADCCGAVTSAEPPKVVVSVIQEGEKGRR